MRTLAVTSKPLAIPTTGGQTSVAGRREVPNGLVPAKAHGTESRSAAPNAQTPQTREATTIVSAKRVMTRSWAVQAVAATGVGPYFGLGATGWEQAQQRFFGPPIAPSTDRRGGPQGQRATAYSARLPRPRTTARRGHRPVRRRRYRWDPGPQLAEAKPSSRMTRKVFGSTQNRRVWACVERQVTSSVPSSAASSRAEHTS